MFKFFRNVSREMSKVSWPKGRELFNYTVTVIATVLFFAVFFGLVDFGISEALNTFFE
ncbi:preprotein translocase subunit SecE [Aciduricibacillus chroicocephali]|uniref:Protein translocase subunit SecE n=1 Tax=Aciduricibacillus chroicocephali TaxID=3054939 RepID=A0ABY9KZ03_9BACI|nr:preprotein translocase subunit SecE [Bacillaceae bacterium 44XB]